MPTQKLKTTKKWIIKKTRNLSGKKTESKTKKIIIRKKGLKKKRTIQKRSLSEFKKHPENPIIEARENNDWEAAQTFNPAAVFADGSAHIFYRAIGKDGVSRIGYAKSKNGIEINERLNYPVYEISKNNTSPSRLNNLYHQISYVSGGGFAGSEDPRTTLIDDKLYMLYVHFGDDGYPRMALTSLRKNDLLHKKWKWKKPAIISKPGEIHKNWVIFPEKIGGKYAILHSISPEIAISYFDDLDFENGTYINSYYQNDPMRKKSWDNWVRGSGPPPIKTKDGWLLLYHAMDNRDPGKYKVGAMILDLNDPTKILYRSEEPILEPNQPYENHGFKGGVVYACGAVVIQENLLIYYGGSDSNVNIASVNLDKFLEQIKKNSKIQMEKTEKVI